jgi:hypothetical protein
MVNVCDHADCVDTAVNAIRVEITTLVMKWRMACSFRERLRGAALGVLKLAPPYLRSDERHNRV